MSRKTRRHPNRPRPPRLGPPLRRVEPGHYEMPDGTRIKNMNDGKRDAWWVAFGKSNMKVVDEHARTIAASTLREVCRKLAKLAKLTAPKPIMVACDHCDGEGEAQAECDNCWTSLTTANQSKDPELFDYCKQCAGE